MNKQLTLIASLLLVHGVVQADVVTDGSLGAATNLSGPDFQIDANLGTQAGDNLFHSFSEFSVASGESATFNGPASVNNIISRVTGGAASQIDGILASTISGADLYLINPQGVLFGKDAQLNVPGSLYVSTADQIGFADGKVFSASPDGADRLTMAAPAAFGFLTPSPANIRINAENMAAVTGESLHFVGGDIEVRAEAIDRNGIYAEGGGISLISNGGNNWVNLVDGRPELGNQTGGNISLSGNAVVQTDTINEQNSGDIRLQADNLAMVDNSVISTFSDGTGDTGSIRIKVKDMALSESAQLFTDTTGPGNAGSIDITADQLNLTDNALLLSDSHEEATGDAGNITIKVEKMALSESAQIFTTTSGSGHAGSIDIMADQIHLADNTLLLSDAFEEGNAGNITIKVEKIALSGSAHLSTVTSGSGNAGTIEITADQIHLTDDIFIASTFSEEATGDIGDIRLEASQSIQLTENATIGIPKFRSVERREGNSGNIHIITPYLSLIGQGDTDGDGNMIGDSAHITVDALSGSIIPPGTITIRSDQIHMENGATISAKSDGLRNAGNIMINGADSLSLHDAFISTDSSSANGGNIQLSDFKQIDLQNSRIAASAGVGDGGNVSIANNQWVVLDSGHISADSAGASGGRLNIQSTLVRTPDSTTTARGVAQAQDGEVLITDEINPDQVLLDLALGFLANEVKAPCSVAVAEESVVLHVNATQGCRR